MSYDVDPIQRARIKKAFKQAASGFKGSLMASATMDVQSQVA